MQRLIAMLALTLFAPAVWAQSTVVGMPTKPQPAPPQQNIISVGTGKYKLGYDGRGKGNYGKSASTTSTDNATMQPATVGAPAGTLPPSMSQATAPKAISSASPASTTTTTSSTKSETKKMRSDSALKSDSSTKNDTAQSTTASSAETTTKTETTTTAPAATGAAVLVGGKLVTQ